MCTVRSVFAVSVEMLLAFDMPSSDFHMKCRVPFLIKK